jgi:hypothetical protein
MVGMTLLTVYYKNFVNKEKGNKGCTINSLGNFPGVLNNCVLDLNYETEKSLAILLLMMMAFFGYYCI